MPDDANEMCLNACIDNCEARSLSDDCTTMCIEIFGDDE
jgi:hypothetical protein